MLKGEETDRFHTGRDGLCSLIASPQPKRLGEEEDGTYQAGMTDSLACVRDLYCAKMSLEYSVGTS